MAKVVFRRISIIALGLLGGSLAAKLRQSAPQAVITAYDIDPVACQNALKAGDIDVAAASIAAAADADLIIICTPVETASVVLGQLAGHVSPDTIITDVCSTKAGIVAAASKILGDQAKFIGSHPIAGSHRSGYLAADASLFDGKACVVTPSESGKGCEDALSSIKKFWTELIGMRVTEMSPSAHDEVFARLSHFPHIVAAMLMGIQCESDLSLAGSGLADSTRIAAGQERMWTQICMSNRENILTLLGDFKSDCDKLSAILDKKDKAALEKFFREGRIKRQQLDEC